METKMCVIFKICSVCRARFFTPSLGLQCNLYSACLHTTDSIEVFGDEAWSIVHDTLHLENIATLNQGATVKVKSSNFRRLDGSYENNIYL